MWFSRTRNPYLARVFTFKLKKHACPQQMWRVDRAQLIDCFIDHGSKQALRHTKNVLLSFARCDLREARDVSLSHTFLTSILLLWQLLATPLLQRWCREATPLYPRFHQGRLRYIYNIMLHILLHPCRKYHDKVYYSSKRQVSSLFHWCCKCTNRASFCPLSHITELN